MTDKLERIEMKVWALKGSLAVLQGAEYFSEDDRAADTYLLTEVAAELDREIQVLISELMKGDCNERNDKNK